MASPITYKRLVLSGDKAKETADEVKAKMSKDWKKDFPDGSLDIKAGLEDKMVIDIKTKESSAASLASKIKDIATRNKVDVVTKDKPTLKAVKENQDDLMDKIKKSLMHQVGNPKGEPMSKGQNLPANTKIEKPKVKEIYKSILAFGANPVTYKTGPTQIQVEKKIKKSELKEIIKNFKK